MTIHEFLKQMRILINAKKRRFVNTRDNRYFYDILLEDFGITVEQAWTHIKTLKVQMEVADYKPTYENADAFVFKKLINGVVAYIKVKIESNSEDEEVVCISFHKDEL